jgi:hypothetical protein
MLLFSNGGAKKKKGSRKAKVVKGRLSPPVDVRSKGEVADLEKLLGRGPLTLVLVYADWCGACHRFKANTWNNVTKMTNRTMNIGSVREDMLPETSLANSKISHYPSLLLVGADKRPAEFVTPDGEPTNALPNDERKNIEQLLKTPVEEIPEVTAANNLTVQPVIEAAELETEPTGMMEEIATASQVPNMSEVEALETLPTPKALSASARPPNANIDLKTSIQNATAAANSPSPKPIVGGSRTNAGSLYTALTSVVNQGLPAALLVAGTQIFKKQSSRSRSRRTRKVRGKGQKRNKLGRFSRRR